MLSFRTGLLKSTLRPLTLIKPCPRLPVCNQIRTYALSRFEERRAGVGRTRPKITPRSTLSEKQGIPEDDAFKSSGFDKSSDESSPLWEASQRPPVNNPEEGLRTLLMQNDQLIITRQIEMMNIFIGFEQTNKYVILLGYIAEEPRGILSVFSRQLLRTHRPFRAVVLDRQGSPILWLRRPFAWINSRMFVQRLQDYENYTSEGNPVLDTFAEVQQRWHFWRRKYDLFLRKQETHRVLSLASDPQPEPELNEETFYQFARIDEGLWAWDFSLKDARGVEIASVNRTFRGFGRELFTDTGRYFVRFTPQPTSQLDPSMHPSIVPDPKSMVVRDLTLDERALILATAVNIDFDYFSRHSEGHGIGLWHFTSFGSDA
ncbi:unnamed protein product [Somion occarium]|uniref:Phospholipid scramblase n=1 Tax=Somion occarium TaxID=3059160 RepID=A0ABP1DAV3_9APHY